MDLVETVLRELKKQISREEYHEENPLVVIGLSPEILNLGLSADELWRYCRSVSRNLVSCFHPDRKQDLGVEEYQRRYARAFELLKDKEVFKRALEEFELQTRAERSELNRLRKSFNDLARRYEEDVADVKGALIASEGKVKRAEIALEALEKQYKQYVSCAGTDAHRLPFHMSAGVVHTSNIGACRHLLLIDIEWQRARSGIKKGWNEVQALKEEIARHVLDQHPKKAAVIEELRSRFYGTEARVVQIGELIQKAIESPEILPKARWDQEIALMESGLGELVPSHFSHPSKHKAKKAAEMDALVACRQAGFSDNWLSGFYRHCLENVKNFLTAGGISFTEEAAILPRWLTVEHGCLLDATKFYSETITIVGSVDPLWMDRLVLPDHPSVGIELDSILCFLEPWISIDSFLICKEEESYKQGASETRTKGRRIKFTFAYVAAIEAERPKKRH